MTIYDGGWPEQPESERESEWHDSEDADESWRGGAQPTDEEWKEEAEESYPGEKEWGDYWHMRGRARADDEDERRNRRRRRDDYEGEDGS